MENISAKNSGDSSCSVTGVTEYRQKRVVLGALAVVVGMGACSSSPGTTADQPVIERPPAPLPEEVQPQPDEPVCELTGPPLATQGDVLVYGDEFGGGAVDPQKWTVAEGYRGHASIANTASKNSAVVRDGSLFIVTEPEPTNPKYPYRSGWLDTFNKYARTYGKIEFRARFPFASGVWYAMWGKPWAGSFPEIDIELLNDGAKVTKLYFVNHWAAPPLPADQRRSYAMFENIDVSEFHTYTILWKPDLLEWSVDGVSKMLARPQGIPSIPVYWIINGWVGGWGGMPTEKTTFPVTFEVDYFRVSRVDGLMGEPVIKVIDQRAKYSRKDTLEVLLANFDEACAHVDFYDGENLVWRTSTPPFRFPLSRLRRAGAGMHTLTFTATDGKRKTTTSFDARID